MACQTTVLLCGATPALATAQAERENPKGFHTLVYIYRFTQNAKIFFGVVFLKGISMFLLLTDFVFMANFPLVTRR